MTQYTFQYIKVIFKWLAMQRFQFGLPLLGVFRSFGLYHDAWSSLALQIGIYHVAWICFALLTVTLQLLVSSGLYPHVCLVLQEQLANDVMRVNMLFHKALEAGITIQVQFPNLRLVVIVLNWFSFVLSSA